MDPAVPLLQRLGLTQYQAKTYVALVGLGPSTAAEIAEAADVPRTRIYTVLSDLEEGGWLEGRPGRPKTFHPVRPAKRIGRVREALVDEIDTVIPALEAQYEEEATRFGGPIWLLDTADALARRTLEMVKAAREDLMLVAMFPLPCDGEPLDRALSDALDRGVRVRVLAPDPETAAGFLRLGADVRVTWVPPRFLFVDARQALLGFPIRTEAQDPGARGVWIPAPGFIEHISPIRHEIWEMGQPLDAALDDGTGP